MSKSEKTSRGVGSKASSVLKDSSASKSAKSIAGSVLSQAKTNKVTSKEVATKAARALDNPRTNSTNKTIAGSALTQKPRTK